jgi:hypothetical protein
MFYPIATTVVLGDKERVRAITVKTMREPTPAKCSEETALSVAFQEVIKRYLHAVAELRRIRGTSSWADYDSQYRRTDALRMDAQKALNDLENHVADHGCHFLNLRDSA